MYPTKQHSTEEHAEAEEGWKLPTNGEYLRRRQAERFLGRSEWYLKLQELILPELRGVAMRGSAARWPTGEDAVATIELRKGEGVTLDMMDGLVQTPPRTVRHPRHPPLPPPAALHPPAPPSNHPPPSTPVRPTDRPLRLMPCSPCSPCSLHLQLALHLLYDQLKRAQSKEKGSDEQQAALRAALGGLKGLYEGATYSNVEAELRRTCPEALLKKLDFENRFEAQLQATVTKLAAIAIFEVTAVILRAPEGKTPAMALAAALGKLVLTQYETDAVQFAATALKVRWEGFEASNDPAFEGPVRERTAAEVAAEVAAAAAAAAEAEVAILTPRQQARKEATDAWLARHELDRQQSRGRRMVADIDTCVSPQATTMLLRNWRQAGGSAEIGNEIGAVLASQPQWTQEATLQVGSYLMDRLAKVASMPARPTDDFDTFWGAHDDADDADDAGASWDAPPPPLEGEEEAGAEAGGEAGGAQWEGEMVPAFSFVDERAYGSKAQTKYLQASAELEPLMLPTAMTPNELRDRWSVHPAEFPMLTPPLAWTKSDDENDEPVGGCFHHSTKLVRTYFGAGKRQLRSTPGHQLQSLFDALDSLAATEWRINRPMLDLALKLFEERPEVRVSFLPDRVKKPEPEQSEAVRQIREILQANKEAGGGHDGYLVVKEHEEFEAYSEWRAACEDVKVHNANLHSQLCTARLQLDVASEYSGERSSGAAHGEASGERRFFFPYNVDFRGRAYPVSPYLSHIGDDLCRGLLLFGEARPLGASGYRWLKIHLANLYGMDKLPLARREAWADEALGSGILAEVADDPLGAKAVAWWHKAESTLQAIAVATELHAASTHRPDGEQGGPACPERYTSSMPVHQDGSCNGLQHYAALLRDTHGATQARPPRTRPACACA